MVGQRGVEGTIQDLGRALCMWMIVGLMTTGFLSSALAQDACVHPEATCVREL